MNFLEKSSLKNLLKLSLVENLEESKKMVHNPQEYFETSTALICEVPNLEEFRNINMKIMNSAFFENKFAGTFDVQINKVCDYMSYYDA